jgi:hypothetical protein
VLRLTSQWVGNSKETEHGQSSLGDEMMGYSVHSLITYSSSINVFINFRYNLYSEDRILSEYSSKILEELELINFSVSFSLQIKRDF